MTVIATGPLVHHSVDGRGATPRRTGISVEVVDPRTLQPLDEDAIVESVKKTNRGVVAHEAVTRMGFGAEVAAVLQYQAFDWLDAPIERVGARFAPLAFAPVMEQFVVPHADDVLAAIRRTVGKQSWRTRSSSRGSARAWRPGTIVRWLKYEGDTVEKGEPLYELDTDKVTQEVEAEAAGVLLKIALPRGRGAGRPDDRRDRRGRAKRSRRPEPEAKRAGSRPRAREPSASRSRAAGRARRVPAPQRAANGGRVKASPLARRIARERGIDLRALRGTGPEGRIVAEDVERAAARRRRRRRLRRPAPARSSRCR